MVERRGAVLDWVLIILLALLFFVFASIQPAEGATLDFVGWTPPDTLADGRPFPPEEADSIRVWLLRSGSPTPTLLFFGPFVPGAPDSVLPGTEIGGGTHRLYAVCGRKIVRGISGGEPVFGVAWSDTATYSFTVPASIDSIPPGLTSLEVRVQFLLNFN